MQIIIASKNLNKIREYRSFLKKVSGLDVHSLIDYPNFKPLEETGSTFEQNAKDKALYAAKELGAHVIADDSGLVVPFLNDQPGVMSARYAGPNATDRDNREKLMEKVKDLSPDARAAFFECAITMTAGVITSVVLALWGLLRHALKYEKD